MRGAMYQSDLTCFLNQLKRQKPELDEAQRCGRALWWDKPPLDLDVYARAQASCVPQPSYVYYQSLSEPARKPPLGRQRATALADENPSFR